MTAQDILLSLEGKRLDVWKVSDGKVAVSYKHCNIKDGCFLITTFGTGKTFVEACEDYLNKLHGKTLVFDMCSQPREVVKVL